MTVSDYDKLHLTEDLYSHLSHNLDYAGYVFLLRHSSVALNEKQQRYRKYNTTCVVTFAFEIAASSPGHSPLYTLRISITGDKIPIRTDSTRTKTFKRKNAAQTLRNRPSVCKFLLLVIKLKSYTCKTCQAFTQIHSWDPFLLLLPSPFCHISKEQHFFPVI